MITDEAIKVSIDPKMALAVARCESGLNPSAKGDFGASRGLWQIHKPSHPDITDEQAFDPTWSTKWAMKNLEANPQIWTCYRQLYAKNNK